MAMKQVAKELKEVSGELAKLRDALETEKNEMSMKLKDANIKATDLEDKRYNEAKEREYLAQQLLEKDNSLNEMQIKAEQERRKANGYKEQLEKINNRVMNLKTVKKPVDEAEEAAKEAEKEADDVARSNAQKRDLDNKEQKKTPQPSKAANAGPAPPGQAGM